MQPGCEWKLQLMPWRRARTPNRKPLSELELQVLRPMHSEDPARTFTAQHARRWLELAWCKFSWSKAKQTSPESRSAHVLRLSGTPSSRQSSWSLPRVSQQTWNRRISQAVHVARIAWQWADKQPWCRWRAQSASTLWFRTIVSTHQDIMPVAETTQIWNMKTVVGK